MQQELTRMTNQARGFTNNILANVHIINAKAEKVDLSHAVYNVRTWGYWRYAW